MFLLRSRCWPFVGRSSHSTQVVAIPNLTGHAPKSSRLLCLTLITQSDHRLAPPSATFVNTGVAVNKKITGIEQANRPHTQTQMRTLVPHVDE